MTDESIRGVPAREALLRLLAELTDVTTVEFLRLRIPPSVEFRPGATAALSDYASQARASQPPGDSFTETFIGVAADHGDLESALDVVGYHQPLSEAAEQIAVDRAEVTSDRLSRLAAETPRSQILVFSSRVKTSAGIQHIPLLDFKMPAVAQNDSLALSIARRLGGGIVVNSGTSYHLYGDRLLSEQELTDWLLRAQLLSRCVDTRWVTHQLIERRAALRLTRGGDRNADPIALDRVAAPSPISAESAG